MPMPPNFIGPVVAGSSVCASAIISASAARGTPVYSPIVLGGAQPLQFILENHDDRVPNGTFAMNPETSEVVVNTPDLEAFCGCLPEFEGTRFADVHIEVIDNNGIEALQSVAISVEVTGCLQSACPTSYPTRESSHVGQGGGGYLAICQSRVSHATHPAPPPPPSIPPRSVAISNVIRVACIDLQWHYHAPGNSQWIQRRHALSHQHRDAAFFFLQNRAAKPQQAPNEQQVGESSPCVTHANEESPCATHANAIAQV